jgi:hypothetical protein
VRMRYAGARPVIFETHQLQAMSTEFLLLAQPEERLTPQSESGCGR